jgi:CheY-like chemotaxis protein
VLQITGARLETGVGFALLVLHEGSPTQVQIIMATQSRTESFTIDDALDREPLVLLVDDNTPVRQACALFCERNGFHVAHASDAPEAIDKAFELRPDVIVLDLVLPTQPGWEVAALLRTDDRTSHIPILATSGLAAADAERKAISAGASQFLAKPFDGATLVSRIRKLLAS